jgi:hypothetical protein
LDFVSQARGLMSLAERHLTASTPTAETNEEFGYHTDRDQSPRGRRIRSGLEEYLLALECRVADLVKRGWRSGDDQEISEELQKVRGRITG